MRIPLLQLSVNYMRRRTYGREIVKVLKTARNHLHLVWDHLLSNQEVKLRYGKS